MKALTTENFKGLDANILEQLAQGEDFVITHNGKPVARMTGNVGKSKLVFPPLTEEQIASRKNALENLAIFREAHPLDGITIRELIDEGRNQ